MKMNKRYIEDDLNNTTHATFFCFSDADAIITGTKWLAMNPSERCPAYEKIESTHGIRFFYKENISELPFYTIPSVYLFAEDVSGGYLGRFPAVETMPEAICYFKNSKCYLVASDIKSFLRNPFWKEQAEECPLIEVFHSREHALHHYDIALASTLKGSLPSRNTD